MDVRTALISNFEKIDAAWFERHPEVRVIGSPTTGLDHIDLGACAVRGVNIVSLRGERRFLKNVTSTAEHTMGLILALARNYKTAWSSGERTMGMKLKGKTIGILGSRGRIGRQMAKLAKAFGMNVIGVDKSDYPLWLWRDSDIVTVHIPLNGNEGLIKKRHFALMKPTAFFVNTSRTKIVEDGALLKALKDGLIAGAAVDFVDDLALVEYERTHNNLLLTPHVGGNTAEDRALTDEFIKAKLTKKPHWFFETLRRFYFF